MSGLPQSQSSPAVLQRVATEGETLSFAPSTGHSSKVLSRRHTCSCLLPFVASARGFTLARTNTSAKPLSLRLAVSNMRPAAGQATGVNVCGRVRQAAPFGWHPAGGPDYLEIQTPAASLPTSASCSTAVTLIGSALLSCQAQLGRGGQSPSRIPASAPALPTASFSTSQLQQCRV